MPYIKVDRRKELLAGLNTAKTAGELNYMITLLLLDYRHNQVSSVYLEVSLKQLISTYWGENRHNYQTANDILGACDASLREFRRRLGESGNSIFVRELLDSVSAEFYENVVASYEDLKIKENSDVYPEIT